ncbi:hypothetical protein ACHAQH_001387 [Verticillium albo-atrum]
MGAEVFGGVDTLRYTGSLQKISVVPAAASPDGFTRYWVNTNGTTRLSGILSEQRFNFERIPRSLFDSVLAAFPEATAITGSNQYTIDCSVAEEDGSLSFSFGGAVVEVPLRNFIWRQSGTCFLGTFRSDGL